MGAAVSIIPSPPSATHQLGGAHFTSLATPSRGSTETSVWLVEIEPSSPPTPHSVTREEVFVVLSGTARVELDGVPGTAQAGDAIVVPAGVPFALSNDEGENLRLLCCLPVGGQARMGEGEPFTPLWAQ
jgi:quercetin dioxygenase-like cupin family protein